jgi:ribosomal protein S6--L-glutamate ligase
LRTEYIKALNGFPIILKISGGSGGIGTMLVYDFNEYISMTDDLIERGISFELKEYIKSSSVERYNVVGDKVFSVFSRNLSEGEFKSDSFNGDYQYYEPDHETYKQIIDIRRKSNLYIAGIDMIRSRNDGKNYLLEVNFPANFIHVEKIAGDAIHDEIVKFLANS